MGNSSMSLADSSIRNLRLGCRDTLPNEQPGEVCDPLPKLAQNLLLGIDQLLGEMHFFCMFCTDVSLTDLTCILEYARVRR